MTTSYDELVARAKAQIAEVEAGDLADRLESVLLIDIRQPYEFEDGAISGAKLVPRGVLEQSIGTLAPSLDTEIVCYCAVGMSSALAAQALQNMGYTNVASLAGGIQQWMIDGRPTTTPTRLSPEQRIRYSRHLRLPELGEIGQAKLLEGGVLVVGAGGLGSSVAMYLAAAGVGRLGIIDFDDVELSNLQRQLLHTTDRVGRPKVESATQALRGLNPGVAIDAYPVRLDSGNALEVLGDYDVIVDGSDDFPTRYLVNDAALHLRTPVVHGSILRFEGHATVFHPYQGPCYRCLFPAPPPPELAPSCADAGVLGAMAGVIGSIQAMEAIKLLAGVGQDLSGRLLTYDALNQEFWAFAVDRAEACPACSDEGRPPELVDYDAACIPAGSVGRGDG